MIRGFQPTATPFIKGVTNHLNQRPDAVSPSVDLSHLTEEERMMIQSVMVKAELSDHGIPVDTSMPSSTNLPSNISQALTQQRTQQQQHQMQLQTQQRQQQQQQLQQQQHNFPQQGQENQNQRLMNHNQQYQQNQSQMQNPTNIQQTMFQQQQQSNQMQQPYLQGQQQPMQRFPQQGQSNNNMHTNQPTQMMSNQMGSNMNQQLNQQQQQGFQQQGGSGINTSSQQRTQPVSNMTSSQGNSALAYHQAGPSTSSQLSSLERQTQSLVSQINSQFNLGGQSGQLPKSSTQFNSTDQSTRNLQQPQQQQQQLMQDQNVNSRMANSMYNNSNSNNIVPVPNMNVSQQSNQPQLSNLYNMNQQNPMHNIQQVGSQAQQQLSQMPQQGVQMSGNLNSNQAQQFYNQQMPMQQTATANLGNVNYQMPGLNQQFAGIVTQPEMMQNVSNFEVMPMQGMTYDQQMNLASGYQFNPNQQNYPFSMQPSANMDNRSMMMDQYDLRQNIQHARRDIRFGPDQSRRADMRGDYVSSDHEISFNRGQARNSRDGRAFRRYDSLNIDESNLHHDDRQRSQDLHQRNRSEPRRLPKLERTGKLVGRQSPVVQSVSQFNNEQRMSRSKRRATRRLIEGARSSSFTSESESEIVPDYYGKVLDERVSSPRSPSMVQKDGRKIGDDKSILTKSELKIAEQVMEQQQLLIKQSQELIKLQQAQLKQQTKSHESKNLVDVKQEGQSEARERYEERSKQPVASQNSVEEKCKIEPTTYRLGTIQDATQSNKKQECNQQAEINQGLSKTTSISSMDLINLDNDHIPDSSHRDERKMDQQRAMKKSHQTQPLTRGPSALERVLLSSRNLDLRPSTCSSDSDSELISSQYNALRRARHQSRAAKKQGNKGVHVRREPTGLPPSPLPVSAAIQLHQMHQKHSRNHDDATRVAALRRNDFIRSRSVCNSPVRLSRNSNNFNRSIDTGVQNLRLDSCDMNSDYGDQEYRKLLPEPPSNSVPLTPSMVRKMVQAQKAAATSSNKLLTSVNAKSTLMTNTHSFRNPCIDRALDEQLLPPFDNRVQGRRIANYLRASGAQVSFRDPRMTHDVRSDLARATRTPEIGRFINYPYGTSILKSSKPTNTRDTSDLESILREIDQKHKSAQAAWNNSNPSSSINRPPDVYQRNYEHIRARNLSTSTQNTAYLNYGTRQPERSEMFQDSMPNRRSSEGESSRGAHNRPSHLDYIPSWAGQMDERNTSNDRQSYSVSSPSQQRWLRNPMNLEETGLNAGRYIDQKRRLNVDDMALRSLQTSSMRPREYSDSLVDLRRHPDRKPGIPGYLDMGSSNIDHRDMRSRDIDRNNPYNRATNDPYQIRNNPQPGDLNREPMRFGQMNRNRYRNSWNRSLDLD